MHYSYIQCLWREDENVTDDIKCHLTNSRHSYNTVADCSAETFEHKLSSFGPDLQPDPPMKAKRCVREEDGGRLRRSAPVKVSMLSELGVLSGVYAGLASLFEAAAANWRLLGDVSQRVRANQVPGRAGGR